MCLMGVLFVGRFAICTAHFGIILYKNLKYHVEMSSIMLAIRIEYFLMGKYKSK